jgi:hypothetical protein
MCSIQEYRMGRDVKNYSGPMLCWIDLGFAWGQRRNIAKGGVSLTIAILVLHQEVSDSF